MGRGIARSHGHKLPEEIAAERSKLEFDYTYYNAQEGEAVAVAFVGVDCDSGAPLALPPMIKDADSEFLVAGVEYFMKRLSH